MTQTAAADRWIIMSVDEIQFNRTKLTVVIMKDGPNIMPSLRLEATIGQSFLPTPPSLFLYQQHLQPSYVYVN
jgi:hypothetical protein